MVFSTRAALTLVNSNGKFILCNTSQFLTNISPLERGSQRKRNDPRKVPIAIGKQRLPIAIGTFLALPKAMQK